MEESVLVLRFPGRRGLVVTVSEHIQRSLFDAAQCHSLSILCAPDVDLAFRAVVHLRPQVIIVQVSGVAGEALKLIRMFRDLANPMPVVGAAVPHGPDAERAVRQAGATWYVPAEDGELVIHTLESLLSP